MYLQRCVTTTFVQGHQIFLIRQGNCHSLPQSFSTPAHTLDLASPGKWLYSLITLYHYWHFTPFDLVFTCLSTDGCKTCLHLGEHELFSFEHWCVGIWIIVFIFSGMNLGVDMLGHMVLLYVTLSRIGFHTGGNILFWEDKMQQYIIASGLWP